MAVTFTGAGVASAASGASPQAVTTATAFAVGDYLVALIAYDNSGGGGADPMTGTISLAPATGALGASVSAQTGLNDPGAVSAGLAVRCVAFPVTTVIPTSTSVNVSWTGTVVVRAVAFIKASGSTYRTNSGATGGNTVAAAASTALVTPSVTNAEGLLCWVGHENGAAVTGDADSTNGTWSAVYGTFNGSGATGMAAYFQSKIVTATATQSFSASGTSSDWITGCLIFTAAPLTSSQTNPVGIVDSVTVDAAHFVTQTDPVGILDNATVSAIHVVKVGRLDLYDDNGDPILFDDEQVWVAGIVTEFDTALSIIPKTIVGVPVTDGVGLTDSITVDVTYLRDLTDPVGIVDDAIAFSGFNPFSLAWHTVVWADDPYWSNPGDGNAVPSWRDGSGNGHTLTQATGGNQPIFRSSVALLNNHAAVDFDGVNDYIETASFTTVIPTFSAVWIGKRDGAGSGPTGGDRMFDFSNYSGLFSSTFMDTPTGKWGMYLGTTSPNVIRSSVSYDTSAGHAIHYKVASASSAIVVDGITTTDSQSTNAVATHFQIGGAAATPDYGNIHTAFGGLYAGDVTADANWPQFVAWVSSYYGLNLNPAVGVEIADPVGITDSIGVVTTSVRDLTDPVGLLDGADAAEGYQRTRDDLIGLLDSAAAADSYLRSQTDLIGLLDAAAPLVTISVSQTDAIGLLDAADAAEGYQRSQTDPVGLLDAATPSLSIVVSLTDNIGLLDAATASTVLSFAHTDNVGLLDSIALDQGYGRSLTDPVGLVDDATTVQGHVQTKTDLVGILDDESESHSLTLTDVVGLTDAATASAVSSVALTDPIGLLDTASTLTTYLRPLTDPVGLVDDITISGTGATGLTDLVGIVDSVTTTASYVVTLTDAVGLLDVATADLTIGAVNYTRTVTDPVGLVDSASAFAAIGATQTDAIGLLDALSTTSVYARTQDDIVGLTDAITDTETYQRSLTDLVGIVDTATAFAGQSFARTDVVGITDSISVAVGASITVVDLIGGVDNVITSSTTHLALTDAVGLVDTTTTAAAYLRSYVDPINIPDTWMAGAPNEYFVTDPIGVTDTLTAGGEFSFTLTDQIGITDLVTAASLVVCLVRLTIWIEDALLDVTVGDEPLAIMVGDPTLPVTLVDQALGIVCSDC